MHVLHSTYPLAAAATAATAATAESFYASSAVTGQQPLLLPLILILLHNALILLQLPGTARLLVVRLHCHLALLAAESRRQTA
jgi:hypothetical protein